MLLSSKESQVRLDYGSFWSERACEHTNQQSAFGFLGLLRWGFQTALLAKYVFRRGSVKGVAKRSRLSVS